MDFDLEKEAVKARTQVFDCYDSLSTHLRCSTLDHIIDFARRAQDAAYEKAAEIANNLKGGARGVNDFDIGYRQASGIIEQEILTLKTPEVGK